MKMLKEVLLPVNLKPLSSRMIVSIQLLQEAFQSKIELLHVIPQSFEFVEYPGLLEEAIAQRMDQMKESLQAQGVEIDGTKILHGTAYDRIIEYASERQKNLIILDRNNTDKDGLDVTIEKVVRKAINPVWVVNHGEKESTQLQNILCAFDFSDNSVRVLKNAIVLAKAFSSQLHLVHVIEKPYYDWWNKITGENLESHKNSQIDAAQKFLLQFAFGDVKFNCVYPMGIPYDEILSQIDILNPDLVIIGTRGQNTLKTLLMGSVSEHVTSRLQIPFITMKEQNVFELPNRTFIENEISKTELLPRAKKLKASGFIEEAIFYLTQLVKTNDKNLDAYDELVECYELLGRSEKANEYRSKSKLVKERLWHLKVENEARGAKKNTIK